VRDRIVNLTSDGVVLRVGSVDIIVTAKRHGWTTLKSFTDFGVKQAENEIVVVKLGYLTPDFRGSREDSS